MRTKTWRRSSVGVEGRRVVGRSRRRGGVSPLASAPLWSVLGLGFVAALRARWTLVPVPRLASLLYGAARGEAHCHKTAGAPDQGASRIRKPIQRSVRKDHIPNMVVHRGMHLSHSNTYRDSSLSRHLSNVCSRDDCLCRFITEDSPHALLREHYRQLYLQCHIYA
jgi:hypothetical protein